MRHRVLRAQDIGRMCAVCGKDNPLSLKARFYELENDELLGVFTPCEEHQGYPGRMHGGIATAAVDETIGRAINIRHEEMMWGVTVEFTTKFRKPIPLNQPLRVVGRITSVTNRFFEGTGEVLLPDGEIAATGHGKYLRMPLAKIADFNVSEQEWKVTASDLDPATIELRDAEP